AGLFLVHQTGWYWMDGAVACPVGLNILVVGGKLVSQSFLRLMDASDPDLYSCLRSNNVFLSTTIKDRYSREGRNPVFLTVSALLDFRLLQK
ncbi:MAG: hypothetical protein DRH24_09285, partial [Deltaproteobacteria bacterium]